MKKIFSISLMLVVSAFAAGSRSVDIEDSAPDTNPLEGLYKQEKNDLFSDPLREMDDDEDSFFDELESVYKEKPIQIVPKKTEVAPQPPKAPK